MADMYTNGKCTMLHCPLQPGLWGLSVAANQWFARSTAPAAEKTDDTRRALLGRAERHEHGVYACTCHRCQACSMKDAHR